MEKMNAILFRHTGHLLGCATLASQPERAATTEQVAVDGFRLRGVDDNSRLQLTVPVAEISLALVDFDTRVIYRPHLFAMAEGKLEQQQLNAPPALGMDLDGSNITATLPSNVSDSVEVWCQISGGALTEPIIRAVRIPGDVAPTNTGTEALELAAGDYRVAMFAPGYNLVVFSESVP